MKSIAQQLDEADIMLTNAMQHPIVRQRLAEYGYPLTRLETGMQNLNATRLQVSTKNDLYTQKESSDKAFRTDMAQLKSWFTEHRRIAKLAFRHQAAKYDSLQLDAPVQRRQAPWLAQVDTFYSKLLPQSKVMQRYDVPKSELEQAQATVESLKATRIARFQTKGEAQHATQQQSLALKELRQWLTRFKAAARLALVDEPQLLEILGIVVPAGARSRA